jgi:hypothetical protein
MRLPRPPIEERFDVEQYLDGQWYVVSTEYPVFKGKLIFGPCEKAREARDLYWALVDSYYSESKW